MPPESSRRNVRYPVADSHGQCMRMDWLRARRERLEDSGIINRYEGYDRSIYNT